jgi:P27 family predicted phage terminase small subunit
LPANVHVLRGNPSKLPASRLLDEFRPEVEIPDCPSWLWEDAREEWDRITAELARYGLVSQLDRAALVLYVQAWAMLAWAEKNLSAAMRDAESKRAAAEAAGQVYDGGDGIMVKTASGNFTYSHYWVVKRRAAEDVNRYLAAFGLSPASRSRVTTSDNRQGDLFQDAGETAWSSL